WCTWSPTPVSSPAASWRSVSAAAPASTEVGNQAFTREASFRGDLLLGSRLLQNVDTARRAQTDDVSQPDLGVLDLAVPGLAAKVMADLPDVGDAGGRDRVSLGLQPAGDVHWRRAVTPRRAGVEKVCGTAFFAQHQVVVVHQLGGGEAVV